MRALSTFAVTTVFFVLFAPTQARASTPVSGTLTGNPTWTAAGNPFILTGDVIVPAESTLTIGPGVNILVAEVDDNDVGGDNLIELIVQGGLIINGSPLHRVTFSSQAGPGGWRGITVQQGTGQVSILYASIGGAQIALHTERDATWVTVNHVHFYDMTHTGVLVSDGEPAILASLFTGVAPQTTGIRAIFSGQPIIANNVMAGFRWGIDLNQNVPTTTYISNNTIVAAQIGIHVAPESNSSISAFVTNNIVNGFGFSGVMGIQVVAGPGVAVTLSHNNVTGHTPYDGIAAGPNSLSVLPGYVSDTDYHLAPTSPMIDAGIGPTSNVPIVDHDDVARPVGAGVRHRRL